MAGAENTMNGGVIGCILNGGQNATTETLGSIHVIDALQQLRIEEFRQLHEHIRAFETALSTVFTVSLVACATLLTGMVSLFFNTYQTDPHKIEIALCYLFLIPAFLSMATLALMSSYKNAIYRNGYYIKVFFEETDDEGAHWHVNLTKYRKLAHGEHGDPAALVLWALHGISVSLFIYGLSRIRPHWWHYAMFLPVSIFMIIVCRAFVSNRQSIEDAWHLVQDPKWVAPPPEQQSEGSALPIAGHQLLHSLSRLRTMWRVIADRFRGWIGA